MRLPFLDDLRLEDTGERVQRPRRLGLYTSADLRAADPDHDLKRVVQLEVRIASRHAMPMEQFDDDRARERAAKMMAGRIAHHVYSPVYDALLDLHRAFMDEAVMDGPAHAKLVAILNDLGDRFRGEWAA